MPDANCSATELVVYNWVCIILGYRFSRLCLTLWVPSNTIDASTCSGCTAILTHLTLIHTFRLLLELSLGAGGGG